MKERDADVISKDSVTALGGVVGNQYVPETPGGQGKLREILLELIVSQLIYEGFQKIAADLILHAKLDNRPCQPSNRLQSLLASGLEQETLRKDSVTPTHCEAIVDESGDKAVPALASISGTLPVFAEGGEREVVAATVQNYEDEDWNEAKSSATNTVGLQIDFEDPDIYYFAGGRHVALQTDNIGDEFGPLEPFVRGPNPITIIFSTNEEPKEIDSATSPRNDIELPELKCEPQETTKPQTSSNRLVKKIPVKPNSPLIPSNGHPVPSSPPSKDATKKRSIGADGWETVRSRSNRNSRWSTSSRSSSSSNNDLAGGDALRSDDLTNPEWKETEEESAADEEKIQEKEAALDSAIREEELIEEELRQVEKDFHQIESEVASKRTKTKATETTEMLVNSLEVLETSDVENDAESEEPKKIFPEEEEIELDDCFFVDIAQEPHKAEDLLAKERGRIIALREKLMSPAKPDSAETLRRHQAKLAKAEMNRERLLEAKYNRYVELSERFQALNETTKRLVEERSELISRAEERRKRAVEKRQQFLLDIKRKAHDEESKAKEIAFINLLESQIKRNGFMSSAHAKELEVGGRLQSREEERKTKLEERFVKLSAVLERQSNIKRAWETKLAQMQEKRRRTSERILREKQKRAKERSELALEKARDREERLSALNAAKQAKKEELKKSIQQKQQDTARRHEENMEHIRQKAIELSAPRTSEDTSVRMCTLCKVMIESEVQELAHLRGRAHLDAVKKMEKVKKVPASADNVSAGTGGENFGLKFITDVTMDKVDPGVAPDKNRLKVLKKHCKKLIQKLTTSGKEFEANETPPQLSGKQWNDQTTNKNKIQKNIREMDRIINLFNSQRGSLPMATMLDRLMSETRKSAVRSRFIQDSLIGMGLFPVIQKIFDSKAPDLPQRVLVGASNLVIGATFRNLYNSVYVIRSSAISNILELSSRRWKSLMPDGHRWLCGSPVGQNEPLPVDPLIEALIELMSNVLGVVPDPFDGIKSPKHNLLQESEIQSIYSRVMDIIGYIVGSGIVDRLAVYCSGVRGPVEGQQNVANLLKGSIDFLTMLIYTLQAAWDPKKPDTTQLIAALESSELAGGISMSYSLLLHQRAPTRPRVPAINDAPPSPTEPETLPPPPGLLSSSLVRSTLSLINAFAKLDLTSLQRVLGSEAVSLQFRHIASQLLWQVVPYSTQDVNYARLVHELLMAIGNFTVNNNANQRTIQSGQTPTVLQQLCTLPKEYFADAKLTRYLFPTLIAVTFGSPENEEILKQQNIPMDLLHGFMKTDFGKVNSICVRFLPATKPAAPPLAASTSAQNLKSAPVLF